VRIEYVRAGDAARLRELRLASLQADPGAFGATYESDAAQPASWWERGATLSDAGVEQRMYVVVEDGRWLGLALVRPDDDSPGDAVLNAMWVAPEARGRGAARALCDACAQWAAERGFSALNAAIVAGNEPARRAYESAGFVPSHEATWTGHGRTLQELVLRRPLRAAP
jgi:GNAT superfamily N-acetyltransferase